MPWDSTDVWRDEDETPPPGSEPIWPSLSPDLAEKVAQVKERRHSPQRLAIHEGLTDHQISQIEELVLREAAEGYTNEEIGTRIYLSRSTIKTHIRKACERTGSRNRTHVVARYVRGEFTVMLWRRRAWVEMETAPDP